MGAMCIDMVNQVDLVNRMTKLHRHTILKGAAFKKQMNVSKFKLQLFRLFKMLDIFIGI